MKKIFFISIIFFISFFNCKSFSYESDYLLNSEDEKLVENIYNKFETYVYKKGFSYKEELLFKLDLILKNKSLKDMSRAIIKEIRDKLDSLKEKEINYKKEDNYDLGYIRSTWLWWYNDVRTSMNLEWYSYDNRLDNTAKERSTLSKQRWEISHKRDLDDSYYDYKKITNWFKDRWVVCKNINRITNSENIAWWTYYCFDWECSDELERALKYAFDFYMWEKDLEYKPHYEAIVNPYFTKIWFWLDIDSLWKWEYKFFLTIHYCSEID